MDPKMTQFLQKHLEDTPSSFLASLEELQLKELGDYWLLTGEEGSQTFEANLKYLASSETLSVSEYKNWQTEADFHFVAQTIDGDYLVASKEKIRFIPVSLYKSDIETYSLTLGEFFQAYFAGKLVSKMIPKMKQ